MKTAKNLLALLLTLCCFTSMAMPVSAAEILPMAEGTDAAYTTLAIGTNGYASCGIYVNTKLLSHRVEVNLSLCYINGDTPTEVKSWTIEGTHRISTSKNCYVSKGYDYQVIATITVRDSNGKLLESFPTTSAIVHY